MSSNLPFRHHQLSVSTGEMHIVEAGPEDAPVVVFLHGWPQNWFAFNQVMQLASLSIRAVALDLPGRKRDIARVVHEVISALDLKRVTLVGHDCGGQVVYAYLTQYDDALHKAVIIDVAVPGIEPWSEVIRNPHIWHFAFHKNVRAETAGFSRAEEARPPTLLRS